MIRRLVEAHYFQNRNKPASAQIRFWLLELRTPELLIEVARSNAGRSRRLTSARPLLAHAAAGKTGELEQALKEEETAERERDRLYWSPLRQELEKLRRRGLSRGAQAASLRFRAACPKARSIHTNASCFKQPTGAANWVIESVN